MNMKGRNERPYSNFQKNYRITYTFSKCSADNPLGDTFISSFLLNCAYLIGSIFVRMKCIFIFLLSLTLRRIRLNKRMEVAMMENANAGGANE